jgi:hypothetical protein
MRGYIIRKIFIVLLMLLPVFSYPGCKKQAKCGCGKDVLFSLDKELIDYSSIHYTENGATALFVVGYSTYYFCNPTEMHTIYTNLSADDQLLISGDVFWDCNYVNSASNSSYYNYYKYYNIQVTELKAYLYGKK